MRPREKTALEYNATLKEKFAAHPQVKRIARHRQVPKHIYHERTQQLESRKKIKRKYVIVLIKKYKSYLIIFFIIIGKKIYADIQKRIVFHMFLKKKKMLFQKLNKLLFLLFILRFY